MCELYAVFSGVLIPHCTFLYIIHALIYIIDIISRTLTITPATIELCLHYLETLFSVAVIDKESI